MSNKIKCYSIGAMKGLRFEEYMDWRVQAEKLLSGEKYPNVKFVNPAAKFNYAKKKHKTEREVKDWELYQVRTSYVCILNLDRINNSVGSHFELAAAGIHKIPIVAFGSTDGVHPWILDECLRIENTLEDACYYIREYFFE